MMMIAKSESSVCITWTIQPCRGLFVNQLANQLVDQLADHSAAAAGPGDNIVYERWTTTCFLGMNEKFGG